MEEGGERPGRSYASYALRRRAGRRAGPAGPDVPCRCSVASAGLGDSAPLRTASVAGRLSQHAQLGPTLPAVLPRAFELHYAPCVRASERDRECAVVDVRVHQVNRTDTFACHGYAPHRTPRIGQQVRITVSRVLLSSSGAS